MGAAGVFVSRVPGISGRARLSLTDEWIEIAKFIWLNILERVYLTVGLA
jgi:hypothetical protein